MSTNQNLTGALTESLEDDTSAYLHLDGIICGYENRGSEIINITVEDGIPAEKVLVL